MNLKWIFDGEDEATTEKYCTRQGRCLAAAKYVLWTLIYIVAGVLQQIGDTGFALTTLVCIYFSECGSRTEAFV